MSAAEVFNPDWVSPPGVTISFAMAQLDLSVGDLRRSLDLDAPTAVKLLVGEAAIDERLADALSRTLGASQQFWLEREFHYRVQEAPLSKAYAEDVRELLPSMPIKDMRSFGWLDDYDEMSDADALAAFFLDDMSAEPITGPQFVEAVRFRTSYAHESNPAAVAAWLRQGIRVARRIDCAEWDRQLLASKIPELRALTRLKDPRDFFPRLVDICCACGVAVAFVRTPAGCRTSGATHIIDDRAVIQLSFRYRSDDHFWFTFFHEVGHLILHQDTAMFVEGQDFEVSVEEEEANAFAGETLIPSLFEDEVRTVARDFRAIMRLARKIGVSSGILVGQMQNRGLLRQNQMNFLKTRYDWADLEKVTP